MSTQTAVAEFSFRAAIEDAPTWPFLAAGFSLPIWAPTLQQVSDTASNLTILAVCVLTLYKLWLELTRPSENGFSGIMANAAKLAAKLFWPVAVAFAAAAALVYFTSNRAQAAPAVPPAAVGVVKGRKKSADDAGDDSDAEDTAGDNVPELYQLARSMIGLHEAKGRKPNPDVQKMYPFSGFSEKSDSRKVPWCMVWINYLFHLRGIVGTGSAMARSVLRWGRRIEKPFIGCIICIWRGKFDDGSSGHVGLYAGETATHWKILGANQGDQVKVALFPKYRYDARKKQRVPVLLGFRAPSSAFRSTQVAVAATQATAGAGTALLVASELDETKQHLAAIADILPGESKVKLYIILGIAGLTILGGLMAWYERRRKAQQFGW